MLLLERYIQRECKITALIFQIKSYSVLPWVCHLFQQQGMIFNSCRPMRRQHGQRIFWWFLLWRRLILVSNTRIFHQVLFLGLILFPEYIGTFVSFKIMGALAILFWTIPGIDVENWYRIFLQDLVEWYSERHWRCLI